MKTQVSLKKGEDRQRLPCLLLLLLPVFVWSCNGNDELIPQRANIMFINAYEGATNGVVFKVDNTSLRTGTVSLGTASPNTLVYSEDLQLSASAGGAGSSSPLASRNALLSSGKYYSCFLADSMGTPAMVLVEDSLSAPDSANTAKIRVINLNKQLGEIAFGVQDSVPLFNTVAFSVMSPSALIDSGMHKMAVYNAADRTNPIASIDFQAVSGSIYSFFIWGPVGDNKKATISYIALTEAQ